MINAEIGICFLSDEEEKEKAPKQQTKKSTWKPENERVYSKKRQKRDGGGNATCNKATKETTMLNSINTLSINPLTPSKTLQDLKDQNTPEKTSSEKLDYTIDLDHIITNREFEEEKYYGNIEYKLKLINKSKERIECLITQMEFRLREGHGTCFYEIGVEDSGNPLGLNEEELKMSLDTIHYMSLQIGAQMTIVNFIQGKEGLIAEAMINKKEVMDIQCKPEIRIGLIGEEDSGKSTLVGCLVSGVNDNGKGLTRHNVFRFKHEIKCGKTSSISHQIVGFDEKGKVINQNTFGISSWANIVENSVKVINFFDMGGSEKYLKTTVKTLSKNYLDYIFLVIPANKGITNTTCVFLKIALSMNLPIVIVFTKIDLINEDDLGDVLYNFKSILKSERKGKNPLVAQSNNDIVTFSRNINEGILPVFLISNTKGKGMDLFKNFLNVLPVESKEDLYSFDSKNHNHSPKLNREIQFDILDTITSKENDKVIIIAGIVTKGYLIKGNHYKLGPDQNGSFRLVEIMSMHCKKVDVKSASQGQFVSIILDSSVSRETVRSGMVLTSYNSSPLAVKVFEAEVWSIDSTESETADKKIKFTTQPIVHISSVRQSVKMYEHVTEENGEVKLFNDKEEFQVTSSNMTKLYFEFMYSPEFIREGSHILVYESNFKIFGYVTRIIK